MLDDGKMTLIYTFYRSIFYGYANYFIYCNSKLLYFRQRKQMPCPCNGIQSVRHCTEINKIMVLDSI